jgi:hypothetical protein
MLFRIAFIAIFMTMWFMKNNTCINIFVNSFLCALAITMVHTLCLAASKYDESLNAD